MCDKANNFNETMDLTNMDPLSPNAGEIFKRCKNMNVKMPTDSAKRMALINAKAKSMDLIVLRADVSKLKGRIDFLCTRCNVEGTCARSDTFMRTQRPRCCENKDRKESAADNLQQVVKERGHIILDKELPRNRRELITMKCLKHETIFKITREGYKKAQFAAPCCLKASNEEAREAAGIKPRSITGQWRESPEGRKWYKFIKTFCGSACMLTGATGKREHTNKSMVDVHHLYGATEFPHLRAHPKNGILLNYKIHLAFHNIYLQRDLVSCTPDALISFIDVLIHMKNHNPTSELGQLGFLIKEENVNSFKKLVNDLKNEILNN